MDDQEPILNDDYSYIFSSDDYQIVSLIRSLLWKAVRSELLTARQLEVIALVLQILEVLPATIPECNFQVQITGPKRMFGSHEIYHWWHIEVKGGEVIVKSGGHFYRPTTGGDTFTSMIWRAFPGYATEYNDYLDSLSIVDDAQPFDLEIQSIDFSEQGYSLDVFENWEEILEICDNEEKETNIDDITNDELSDRVTLDEAVSKLESAGVECVWSSDKMLASLYSVDLQEMDLTDSLYKLFENIPNLCTFEARNTDISDRTIVFIKHFESLEWLCLRNTAITDAGLKNLQALQSLQHLDLIGTSILGPGLSYLSNLNNLRELYVSGFQHYDEWLEMLRREIPQCSIYLN